MKFVMLDMNADVAILTLVHAGGNRINFQMRQEIFEALQMVASSQVRVLLVKGSGNDFCLGGDIRDWPGESSANLRPRIEVYAKAIDLLENLAIPTIAVVHGGGMGGGFELALGCDLIIASTSARFMFPEALLGIMTLQGGVYQLAERIGRNKAIELVMLSTEITASQMANWNVVNKVVDDAELEATSTDLANRLVAGPVQAYANTKKLMQIWRTGGVLAARAALYNVSMPLFDTGDVQNALNEAVEALSLGRPVPRASFPNNEP